MEFEPRALVFKDVRLNQAYTASLCVTNTYSTAVDFSLLPSSSRYVVNPNRVNLSPGQSIVVTVRLFLNHNPTLSDGTNGYDDTITVKSSYFEHLVNVSFFLSNRDTSLSLSTRQSISPSLRTRVANQVNQTRSRSPSTTPANPLQQSQTGRLNASTARTIELEKQLLAKSRTVQQLESIITQLESKYPSVQEVVRNRIEQERLNFEEKSEKVSDYYTCYADQSFV